MESCFPVELRNRHLQLVLRFECLKNIAKATLQKMQKCLKKTQQMHYKNDIIFIYNSLNGKKKLLQVFFFFLFYK